MALFRPGPTISAISGSIGAITFAARSRRPVARARQLPQAKISAALLQSRANLKRLSTEWRNLTAAQRAAWGTLAATLRYNDALAQARQPTGRQLFLSHNLELLRAGLAPDLGTLPTALDTGFWTGQAFSWTAPGVTDYTPINPIFGPFVHVSIYAQTFYHPTPQLTQPLFENVAGPLPQRWVFIKHRGMDNNNPLDLYPELTQKLGAIAAGQRVAILARWVKAGTFSRHERTSIATAL